MSTETLTAGAVFRRKTWDEIISPEDFAARMYPSGLVRRAGAKLKLSQHHDYLTNVRFDIRFRQLELLPWEYEKMGYEPIQVVKLDHSIASFVDARGGTDSNSVRAKDYSFIDGYYSSRPLTPERASQLEQVRYIKYRERQARLSERFERRKKSRAVMLQQQLDKLLRDIDTTRSELRVADSISYPAWILYYAPKGRNARRLREEAERKAVSQRRTKTQKLRLRIEKLSQRVARVRELLDRNSQRVFTPNEYKPLFYDWRSGRYSAKVLPVGSCPSCLLPVRHRTVQQHFGRIDLKLQYVLEFVGEEDYDVTAGTADVSLPISIGQLRSVQTGHDWSIASDMGNLTQTQESVPEFDHDKFQHALNRVMPDHVDTVFDLPQFAAEWKDLVTNVTGLLDIRKQVRDISKIASKGTAFNPSVWWKIVKLYSGADLLRKFGWTPTLRDGRTLHSVLSGVDPIWQKLEKLIALNGKCVRRSSTFDQTSEVEESQVSIIDFVRRARNVYLNGLTPGQRSTLDSMFSILQTYASDPCVLRTVRDVKWRLTVYFMYSFTDTWGNKIVGDAAWEKTFRDMLGLYLSPKLLWDLTPYSFAVDWLINISSLLDQVSLTRNLRLQPSVISCMVTREITETTVLTGLPRKWKIPTFDTFFSERPKEGECEITLNGSRPSMRVKEYQRFLLDPLDVGNKFVWPTLTKFGAMSNFAKVTSLELLAQKLN